MSFDMTSLLSFSVRYYVDDFIINFDLASDLSSNLSFFKTLFFLLPTFLDFVTSCSLVDLVAFSEL